MNLNFKPSFKAFFGLFLVYRIAPIFIASIVILPLVIIFAGSLAIFIGLIYIFVFFLYISFIAVNRYFAYKKELYIIDDIKIIRFSGDLFNDNKTEIFFDKIISFTIAIPFIQNILFKTQTFFIDSAGTQNISIPLIEIPKSAQRDIFAKKLLDNLKINIDSTPDFATKPSMLGVIIESINSVSGLVFGLLILIVFSINNDFFLFLVGFYFFIIIITLLTGPARTALRIYFTDYYFFKNFIFMKWGILDKFYFYLPDEKFTDFVTNRSIWEKIFGLKNITISAPNNPAIAQLIYLKNSFDLKLIKESSQENKVTKTTNASLLSPSNNIEANQIKENEVQENQAITPELTLRPNPLRYSIDILLEVLIVAGGVVLGILHPPLLVFLLPSISFAFYIASQALEVFFTEYKLNNNSIRREYNFLSTKSAVLSEKNMTSMTITQNPIDKILNTATINFFSLGASESIKISYVDLNTGILEFSKNYMSESVNSEKINANFTLLNWTVTLLKRSLSIIGILVSAIIFYFIFIFDASLLAQIIFLSLLLIVAIIFALEDFFAYQKSYIWHNNNYIGHNYGWINRTKKIIKRDFIKDFISVEYPIIDNGELIVNVAGDFVEVSQDTSSNYILENLNSKSVKLHAFYIPKPQEAIVSIDSRYQNSELISVYQPEVTNSMSRYLIVFFLIPFIFPFIIIHYITLKMTYFFFEENKISSKTGIFFKSTVHLLRSNIDFVNLDRNIFNKIFGNGTINIFTAGSSLIEISIFDIREYKDCLKLLESKL
jgi:uncharacterized membrane protein YdbT with pleckstrin-like domain